MISFMIFNVFLLGTNLEDGSEIAVKLEPIKTKFPQLYYEAKLYKIFNGALGLPKIFHFG